MPITRLLVLAGLAVTPALAAEPAPASDARAEMRARLIAMDTDHDGRLSRAEWLAGGRHERGFAMMDTDKDGYLSVDELRAGAARLQAMRTAAK